MDIYKGIAILLILTHHVFQYFPIMAGITNYITDFHVACFYVASGWLRFLTRGKNVGISYEQFFVKKFRRLLIPYITFALISAVLKIGVLAITHSLTMPIVCDEFYQVLTIGNGPVWFLYRLFLIELIAEYILRVSVLSQRYSMLSVIIALGVITVVLLQGYNSYMIETVRSVLCGCGEFFVGYTLASAFYSSKLIQANAVIIGGGGYINRLINKHIDKRQSGF